MAKVTKDKALQTLRDVPEDKSFWLFGGKRLYSMKDLAAALKDMDKQTFLYHVTSEKNDFAKWVQEVILDDELGGALGKVKAKSSMSRMVSSRLKELQKCAEA